MTKTRLGPKMEMFGTWTLNPSSEVGDQVVAASFEGTLTNVSQTDFGREYKIRLKNGSDFEVVVDWEQSTYQGVFRY